MYKAEDCGLFIGLTTMPFGRECEFYEKEIEQCIFKKYKSRLQQFCDQEDQSETAAEFSSSFYKPKAMKLLSSPTKAVLREAIIQPSSSRHFLAGSKNSFLSKAFW